MSIEIEQDDECGPTAWLSGSRPRYPTFSIHREEDVVDLSAAEALAVGEAMIEWARTQGVSR